MSDLSGPIRTQAYHADQVFEEVRLERVELVSSVFYDCAFVRCSFVESVFRNCRFVNCAFQRCDLSLVQVVGSTFSSTRFEDSKAIGIDWTQADWPTAGLANPVGFFRSAISHSTFIGLRLRGIRIRDCVAVDVDFREADLSQADFAGTDLSKSLFSGTDLTEADLSRARNYHIDPAHNVLRQARFSLPEAMALLYSLDIVLVEGDQMQ
jgi:uncharacterized protein YjbI with pentapeptide repeats